MLKSEDGRYTVVEQETDHNLVVYETLSMIPVWDRFSHEAGHAPAPGFITHTPPDVWPADHLPALRITDESDGVLLNRGYSYWPSAWVDTLTNEVIVFVGHEDGHPRFFNVSLDTGVSRPIGSLLDYQGTGEGWYWDAEGRIYLCDGPRLLRVNPFSGAPGAREPAYIVALDISETHPGCRLWQAHSSDDGRTHSATVQRIVEKGAYPDLGTVVSFDGRQQFFAADGYTLDESDLTSDGAFLIIKTKPDDDNLVITLATGEERWLFKSQGGLGHSACGPSFMVGADRDHEPRACVMWPLTRPLTPERRILLSSQPDWSGGDLGHVSVQNGVCIVSDGRYTRRVALDGSGETILGEHGMVIPPDTPEWKKYDYQVFGTLSPCGRVAVYMSNRAGRMDAYLLRMV